MDAFTQYQLDATGIDIDPDINHHWSPTHNSLILTFPDTIDQFYQ